MLATRWRYNDHRTGHTDGIYGLERSGSMGIAGKSSRMIDRYPNERTAISLMASWHLQPMALVAEKWQPRGWSNLMV